jgi:hypothetical protein
VEIIEEMKGRTKMPYRMICEGLQLPVGSFHRWRCRIRENLVLIKRPGPNKVEPFDCSVLDAEIQSLDQCSPGLKYIHTTLVKPDRHSSMVL